MDYYDLDIPPVKGTRGFMYGCCGKCVATKRNVKKQGNRRVRHAVRQSLRSRDDRQAHRTKATTSWDID